MMSYGIASSAYLHQRQNATPSVTVVQRDQPHMLMGNLVLLHLGQVYCRISLMPTFSGQTQGSHRLARPALCLRRCLRQRYQIFSAANASNRLLPKSLSPCPHGNPTTHGLDSQCLVHSPRRHLVAKSVLGTQKFPCSQMGL